MPRRKVKPEEDESEDVSEEQPKPKKKVKAKSKQVKATKSKKKPIDSDNESEDLSELDGVDEDQANLVDDRDNDEVVAGRNNQQTLRLDPDTPIVLRGVKPDALLQYLVDFGKETLNPTLRIDCQNALNNLRGGRRHNRNPNWNGRGRGRGGFNPNYGRGGHTQHGGEYGLQQRQGNYYGGHNNYGGPGPNGHNGHNNHGGHNDRTNTGAGLINQYPTVARGRGSAQAIGDDDLYS